MDQDQTVSAIKKMVIGCIIAEYGARQLVDFSKFDLKKRVNDVINSVKSVENWFMFNANTDQKHRDTFRKEFSGNEILLIAELFDTIFGMDEDSLDLIIEAIKKNTDGV